MTDAPHGYRLTSRGRWLLACWGLFLVLGFLLARSLDPDPRHFGTHQQLGLPPCSFKVLLDIPCPTCGMTTCFSHFTRGQFAAAARANVAGLVLATVCLLQIPWSWWGSYTGRMYGITNPLDALLYLLMVLVSLSAINWLWHVCPLW